MDNLNSPIARSRVFVLLDGVFVVKWSDNRVQELLTGQYRHYERRDFGAAITDFELNQLKQAGIVEAFDKDTVLLSPSIERSQFYRMNLTRRVRSYYLNTKFSGEHLNEIQDQLELLGLDDEFHARTRDDFVIILGREGRSFTDFDEAEEARHLLVDQAPEVFEDTVVAFVETTRRD